MAIASSPRSALALSCLLIVLSLPLLFLLSPPKTLPSIPAADELSDLALFRRASSSSSGLRVRLSSPPKLAFLFLTNSPLFFAPLWESFFRGHSSLYNIYIHADPSSPQIPPLSPLFRGRQIPSKPTSRGSPTLISAARRLLAAALLDDPANAYFALLSPHCIPIHSFPFSYSTLLGKSKPKSNPQSIPFPSFIEILSGEPDLWSRYVARGDSAMLPEIPFEQFRVGSQFFVLARRHALLVVRDRRLWRKFRRPCLKSRQNSCYPEEHYFPTLLATQDLQGCTGYTLTRVNWTESVSGHPHTYTPQEITPELLRRLRVSNGTYSYLFARKFSPACLRPLMDMADSVLFRD